MVKAVIFDMGGVLAYDVWEHLLLDEKNSVAAMNGLDFDEVFDFAEKLWEEFAYIPAKNQTEREKLERRYWERLIERFHLSQSVNYFVELSDQFIRPVEGMIHLLGELKLKGLNLAICSNNNEFWLKRQMDKIKLHRFFPPNHIISSCRIGVPKISPNYEMFEAVTEKIGRDKSSTVFIDDRSENIEHAIEYGWTAILFPQESKFGARYLSKLLSRMGV